jgi:hypothetical protein
LRGVPNGKVIRDDLGSETDLALVDERGEPGRGGATVEVLALRDVELGVSQMTSSRCGYRDVEADICESKVGRLASHLLGQPAQCACFDHLL